MPFSEKQMEYFNYANHRWNVKSGATRSGKTYMDYFVIPMRLKHNQGLDGLNLILGNTKGTLQRSVIEPLQNMWGTKLVGNIRSDNTAVIFGEKVYCLGADKANQVDRIRGTSIKYCYGDEIVTWHKDVFDMLKSRLDKSYSCFDGTCNPEGPKHWFKKFLDSDADIFKQSYILDDNPFLPEDVKQNIKREYADTILYDRYVLGKWQVAEGIIFRVFADNPERWILKSPPPDIRFITYGVDFGVNRSKTVFVACGILANRRGVVILDEHKVKGEGIRPQQIEGEFVDFVKKVSSDYPNAKQTYAFTDQPETITLGMFDACKRAGLSVNVVLAKKENITTRIYAKEKMLNKDKWFVLDKCSMVIYSTQNQLWDSKKDYDARLDNDPDVNDVADAEEYSWEAFIYELGVKN